MRKQLHIISTGKQSRTELVKSVLQIDSYIDFLHLRERHWRAKDLIEVILELKQNGFSKEKIIVNDRIDVAQVMNVHGVQLAYHSLDVSDVRANFPQLKISCSVHSPEEAKEKEELGASSVIFGHVFATSSKLGMPPRGLKGLERTVNSVNIPVIAIGGMTPDKVDSVLQTGAAGVAVLSGILLADNVVVAAKQFREKLDEWKGGSSWI